MKPKNLILKGFAESKDGYWQAFCLDFDLAVQGDSFEDVKRKMDSMISEYVHDALVGEDKEHAAQLLTRRAPLSLYLKYYLISMHVSLHHAKNGVKRLLNEPVPLTPKQCH